MKCNNCGAEISDEARFCEKCGARVNADAAGEKGASAAEQGVPAPRPLEQPLSAGAVPFVPMAPAPRGMPHAMRGPRPYEPRPGFSPVQPGGKKPKRATSFTDLAARVPPAPSAEEPRDQRADEVALETDQATWQKYPAANAGSELGEKDELLDIEPEHGVEPDEPCVGPEAVSDESDWPELPTDLEPDFGPDSDATGRLASAPAVSAGPDATSRLDVPSEAPRRVGASPRAIAAIAAVIVIAIVGVVTVGAMTRPAREPAPAPAQSQDQAEPKTDASDPTDAGNDATDEVTVQSSVDDYSWDELSQLSAQIAAADTDSAAMEIAKRYNLCTSSGKLDGTQTKKLQLSDGTKVTMRIVGFRQDERADGSGKAGITMISEDAVATRYISTAGTASGWEGSELRTWMNKTLVDELPDEVSSKLVEVSKKTNGQASTAVTGTSDKLWIPSFSEVVGKLTSGMKRSDVYTPEGDQYQLFANEGVQWGGTYSILSTNGTDGYWWLRSVDPLNNQYYLCVSQSGEPWYSHLPATEHAILMGFSL